MSPKLTGGATLSEHRSATRRAMIDAFEHTLQERGWSDLKLTEVAQRAGVTRTVVYNYFPDKTALLLAWSQQEMDRFLTLVRRELETCDDPVDRLRTLITLVLTELSSQRGASASVGALLPPEDRAAFDDHVAPLTALVVEILEDGMTQDVFVSSQAAATSELVMACLEAQRRSLLAGESVEAAVRRTLPFVMRALGAHDQHDRADR